MTPKEKAWELVLKYRLIEFDKTEDTRLMISMANAKECALITVDEILEFVEDDRDFGFSWKTYYQQVKQEIENL